MVWWSRLTQDSVLCIYQIQMLLKVSRYVRNCMINQFLPYCLSTAPDGAHSVFVVEKLHVQWWKGEEEGPQWHEPHVQRNTKEAYRKQYTKETKLAQPHGSLETRVSFRSKYKKENSFSAQLFVWELNLILIRYLDTADINHTTFAGLLRGAHLILSIWYWSMTWLWLSI